MIPSVVRVRVWLCVAVSLAWIGAATPVAAQTPKGDVSIGYQVVRLSAEEVGLNFPFGWNLDFARNVNEVVGIVGEVGGGYNSESASALGVTSEASIRVHTFMGGVRLGSRANEKVVPFGQVLAGMARVSGEGNVAVVGNVIIAPGFNVSGASTDFALQIGGGIDLMTSKAFGVRLGVDYFRIAGDVGVNAFRFRVGAVFPFGKK